MKKLICVMCCLVVISGVFFGCGVKKNYSAAQISTDSAVELTLYAFDAKSEKVFGLMNLGHGFISVKNITDSPVTVGGYVLGAKKEVSVGTWGQNAHWGIWYNLESKYMSLGRYDGIASITQGITLSKLELLNAYFSANDTWTPLRNCSYFALDAWNSVAQPCDVIDLGWLVTPAEVSARLIKTDGHKINRKITNFDKIGYAINGNATTFNEFTKKDI